MAFRLIETFRDAPDIVLSGITDLDLRVVGGTLHLYAVTRPGGGLTSYVIGDAMLLTDQQAMAAVDAVPASPRLTTTTLNGAEALIVTGGSAARLSGYVLEAGGGIGAAISVSGSPSGAVAALEAVKTAGDSFVYSSRLGDGGIGISRLLANGAMQEVGSVSLGVGWQGVDIADLAQVSLKGETYLLAVSVRQAAVLSFRVEAGGTLTATGSLGATGGLGLAAPSVIETVQVAGVDYALVAGSGSSSISVVRLAAGGALSLADHVIDSLDTRFQSVQAMTTVVVGDRTFVFAGGGDDGITAFTLLPGGRLLLVGTEVQSLGGALENITALAGVVRDGQIELFAAGEGKGITRLMFSPGALAPMILGADAAERLAGDGRGDLIDGAAGNDTITGAGGADILIDGAGVDILSGGDGADTFVLVRDGAIDTITDFELGTDALDLSAWGRIYAVEALEILSTVSGATIRFGSETLVLNTADGRSLTSADFTSAGLFPLTHVAGDPVAAGLRVEGTSGSDTQTGGAGDDTLIGSLGADRLDGGAGFDFADYTDARGSQRIDLLSAKLNTNLAAGDVPVGIEGLIGGLGPDNLRGTTGDNVLRGGGNVDWLYGRRGNDVLEGGVGDDVLLGGVGQDTLIGGANRDRAQYSESQQGLVVGSAIPRKEHGRGGGRCLRRDRGSGGEQFR